MCRPLTIETTSFTMIKIGFFSYEAWEDWSKQKKTKCHHFWIWLPKKFPALLVMEQGKDEYGETYYGGQWVYMDDFEALSDEKSIRFG